MMTTEQMAVGPLGVENHSIGEHVFPPETGDQIGYDPTVIDDLKLFAAIDASDLYPADERGRVYLKTARGATAAPVGILVHNENVASFYSYIDLSGELKPIELGKEYPPLVNNWLKFVKANTEHEGLAYEDPLGRAPDYEYEDTVNKDYEGKHRNHTQSRIGKLARDLKREIDSSEPWAALIKERPNPRYHVRVNDSQRAEGAKHAKVEPKVKLSRRIGQAISKFLVRPQLNEEAYEPEESYIPPESRLYENETEPALVARTTTGELVGPVGRQEHIEFPTISVRKALGDPNIRTTQDFIDAAQKDPEWARKQIKTLRKTLLHPIIRRVESQFPHPQPSLVESVQKLNEAVTQLERRSGLVESRPYINGPDDQRPTEEE